MRVETGERVLISGFIINFSSANAVKWLAIRGLGPSLQSLGIPDVLANPELQIFDRFGSLFRSNNDWQNDPTQAMALNALGLGLQDASESGIYIGFGDYSGLLPLTAILSGVNGGTGVGVLEIYDTNPDADSQLANVSTRGFVGTGDNVMIGGFILGHRSDNTNVVVRGIGPSLSQFGLSPALADPTLELYNSDGGLLATNDNWQDDPISASYLTSLGLAPTDPKESGVFMFLPPGAFTAILAGKNGGTGIGLIEIYNVNSP